MKVRCSRVVVDDAGSPFSESNEGNGFSCFNECQGHSGVYVFQDRTNQEVLYVGKSKEASHDLHARMSQHYRVTDSGGNFHKNWREQNCGRCQGGKCDQIYDGCAFESFKDTLRNCRIIVYRVEGDDGTAVKGIISAIEIRLKFLFMPKYDGEITKMRIWTMKMREDGVKGATMADIVRFVIENGGEESESLIDDGDGDDTRSMIERIDADPAICGGRPRIRGTRVRVSDILELLAAGVSRSQILADYPYLSAADLNAALAFGAARSERPDPA